MSQTIRTPKNAWSRQEVTIDGNVLSIELKWHTRSNQWVISIYDSNSNVILAGIALRENESITKTYLRDPFANGNLWVLRFGIDDATITRNNLGTGFQLIYLTKEEEDAAGL